MNQESLTLLDQIIQSASLELFSAYHVRLDPGPAEQGKAKGEDFAATLGFTSRAMKGALVITIGGELARHSLPRELAASLTDGSLVADWTGELANQLLGRIKIKLIDCGLEITLSTPVVFRGKGLCLFPQRSDLQQCHDFDHDKGGIQVVFQASLLLKDFELVSGCSDSRQGLCEGEVALF